MGQCMRVGDAGALSGTRALDRNWPKSSSFCFSGVSSSTVSAIASLHSASGWGANLTLPNPAHVTRSSRTDARLALQRAAARGYTHQGSACVTPPPELAARHGFDCCQRNMLMSAVAGAPDLPDRGVCPRTHHHGPRLASSDDRPLLRHTRRGVLPASRVSRVPHAVSVLTRGQAVLACKAAMRYKHHALQHRRHQAPQDDALACMCKHSTPACANTPDQHVQTLQPACRTQEAAGRAEKSRQVLSWYTAFCAVTTSVNLATLPLSPVRMDCARPSKRSWVF